MFRSESSSGILQLIDPNATVSVTLSWTKGNGARRVVIARLSNTVNYLPADTTAYTANSLFGAGSSFTLKGLSGGNTYHFAIYEYNGTGSLIVYNFISPLKHSIQIPNNPPSGQASNLTLSSNTDTSMIIRWTRGNGSGTLVVARESSSITQTPSFGIDYLSSASFAAGDTIADGTYVVYKGTDDSTEVIGLSPNKTYSFQLLNTRAAVRP